MLKKEREIKISFQNSILNISFTLEDMPIFLIEVKWNLKFALIRVKKKQVIKNN